MAFSTQKYDEPKIKIGNVMVDKTKQCKYLGVYIDEELKWTDHIEYICNKLHKFIGVFYRLSNKLPQKCIRTLYFAFVYAHLLNGIEIYLSFVIHGFLTFSLF